MTTQPEWHPAIASLVANHYMESEKFYYQQSVEAGKILLEICEALALPLDYDKAERGEAVIMGCWRARSIIDAVKALTRR